MDSINLDEAGAQYIHAVTKLYRTGKYYCEKEVIAKKFLEAALEAGLLITKFSECTDASAKITLATDAMEQLKKSLFMLKIMKEEKYVSERRTHPVTDLAEKIKTTLSVYIAPPAPATPSYDAGSFGGGLGSSFGSGSLGGGLGGSFGGGSYGGGSFGSGGSYGGF